MAILKAEGVEDAGKDDAQALAQSIKRSPSDDARKRVERLVRGKPARWKLKEAAH